MKKEAFSLIEVMAALAIVGLLVVLLSAFLGGGFRQYNRARNLSDRTNRAENAMEAALAYREVPVEGMRVIISDYDEKLEKVEIIDEKSREAIFVALRPKKSLYTP